MVAAIAAALLASAGSALAAGCSVPSGSYPTIQSAVADPACATINVAGGTYTEQVTIARSLKLSGAGAKTVIKAPSVLAPDADGFRNIVEIKGGATVNVYDLTVAGPGPAACGSITSGIAIIGGALADLDDVTVRDIRNEPLISCGSSGWGIRAGTQNGGPPDVGHLIASHVLVTGYLRSGIVVFGSGSTGQVHDSKIQGAPSNLIGPTGIGIDAGALGTLNHNTVTGNQCITASCGPDWFTQGQSFGIVFSGANPGSTASNNAVHGNDGGFFADSGGDIDHNDASANLDFGFVIDAGYASNVHDNSANGASSSCPAGSTSCDGILVLSSGAQFGNNSARNNGHNGIEVSCYPGPFCGVGNTLHDNTMAGNASFDAKDLTTGAGTAGTGNTWTRNNCNTSSPSGLCN
jgi:hypothetical protein